jgi:Arc/MetJ-type ribon-helix-helix transcriptional regulator
MITMNISLNKGLAEIVDKQIKKKKYANRSEFFRDMIRKQYVEPAIGIETLDKNDPDYKLVEERSKDADFVDISEIM